MLSKAVAEPEQILERVAVCPFPKRAHTGANRDRAVAAFGTPGGGSTAVEPTGQTQGDRASPRLAFEKTKDATDVSTWFYKQGGEFSC